MCKRVRNKTEAEEGNFNFPEVNHEFRVILVFYISAH